MGHFKISYIVIVFLLFFLSLILLSLLPSPELQTSEDEILPVIRDEPQLLNLLPDNDDWRRFLSRRQFEVPPLFTSITPWDQIDVDLNLSLSDPFPVLTPFPNLPYDSNVTCLIHKFGFSKTQADLVYNPNRTFRACGNPNTAALSLQDK
jgi:hypothetical protein